MEWKEVTKEEAIAVIESYPKPLEYDWTGVCEPALRSWNDFTLGDWPDSMVVKRLDDTDWPGGKDSWYIRDAGEE